MSFQLVPKSVTLNDVMVLILRYVLPNLVVSEAHRVKVVDKAIAMDNLRLCRGTARCPRYKYSITARWKFWSRFI